MVKHEQAIVDAALEICEALDERDRRIALYLKVEPASSDAVAEMGQELGALIHEPEIKLRKAVKAFLGS